MQPTRSLFKLFVGRKLAPLSIHRGTPIQYTRISQLQLSQSLTIGRTMATAQEYRLKLDSIDLQNGQKVEAEVEGIDDAKVLLLKINDQLRALGPKCTRNSSDSFFALPDTDDNRLWCSIDQGRDCQ
jgi:hypothetical protein